MTQDKAKAKDTKRKPGEDDTEGHAHTMGASSAKNLGASSAKTMGASSAKNLGASNAKTYGSSSAKTVGAVGDDDTEGHSLMLDTDYYIQRKSRDAEVEREARERRQAKEVRSNKPERR